MDRVKILFEDMTFGTEYRFLEVGKDDSELIEVAKKSGIVYPTPDVAIFKGRYALVDKENRNKCTLPKEEVENALETLRFKAIDIDHLRAYTVGTWLYGYLEDDVVITYGAFWKSNYPKEYKDFKNRMAQGKGVDISMEAWGDRVNNSTGYNLTNVHFAGGALLDKEEPAEPTAGVLEFAKVMNLGIDNTETNSEKDLEKSRFYIYDIETILRLVWEAKNPKTGKIGNWGIDVIDFKNNKVVATDWVEENSVEINLTPTTRDLGKIREESREILSINEVDFGTNGQKKQKTNDGGINKMELEKRVAELEASLKVRQEEYAKLEKQLTDAKTASEETKTQLDESKKSLEDANKKYKELEDSIPAKVADAQEKAKVIAERRNELGETFKEMKDEDLLDDLKYENAKLKKENAELKDPEKATEKKLEAGSKKKDEEDPTLKQQKKIAELAWVD